MSKFFKLLRKLGIIVVAIPLLIVGIILIPLPGPGLVVCFIALTLLSFEFEFANSYVKPIRRKFKEIYNQAKARADKIESIGDKKEK